MDKIAKVVKEPRVLQNYLTRVAVNTITSRKTIGTNVFEKDWDLLILLDTCRVDALKEVSNSYNFLNDVERLLSVGSHSGEWMIKTFTEPYCAEINETVFVAGNVWAHRILNERQKFDEGWPKWKVVSPSDLMHLEHAWKIKRENGEDHPEGHAAPDIITDRAIALGREFDFNRMIVHYSLPHVPYIVDAIEENCRPLKDFEKDPFTSLRNGVDRDTIWNLYIRQLHYALRSVETLLDNVEAPTTIISADHGESFGEYGEYGHPRCTLNPYVKFVPWSKTTASDKATYEPEYPSANSIEALSDTTEELLEDMGYL